MAIVLWHIIYKIMLVNGDLAISHTKMNMKINFYKYMMKDLVFKKSLNTIIY